MRPQPDLRSDLCPLVRVVPREKPAQRFSIPSPASPVNPSSHLGMVEFGAAPAMIGLSIPAPTWAWCPTLPLVGHCDHMPSSHVGMAP